jgi:pantoate--beta-alanine ligase
MRAVESLAELRQARQALTNPLGLVPTMGFLHDGHISLVRRAREENPSVAVSIFVNPTQFAPDEDLEDYPRDLDRDLGLLEAAGVDLVWTPGADDVYPEEFQTWVTVDDLTQPLEGARRPGHFKGVTTVVAKLFLAFQPQRAYFGQKDAQQAVVIRRMTRDLNFALDVVVCPIMREPDGLAMSSRNTYLDPAEREAATVLNRALASAEQAYGAGTRDADALRDILTQILAAEPLAEPEYVSAADPDTLQELNGDAEDVLLSMAVRVGRTRLIDNRLLGRESL